MKQKCVMKCIKYTLNTFLTNNNYLYYSNLNNRNEIAYLY